MAGVDASDERVDEAREHLVAQAGPDQLPDRHVVGEGRAGGGVEVGRRPGQPGRGADARGGEGVEIGGHTEELLGRDREELAGVAEEVGRDLGGGDQRVAEPDVEGQLRGSRDPGQERVGGLVDGAAREGRGPELAAEALRLDDGHRCPGEHEGPRRGQAGDPASGDQDVPGRAPGRAPGQLSASSAVVATRRARASKTVGSSWRTPVRAKARPASAAAARASTSTS